MTTLTAIKLTLGTNVKYFGSAGEAQSFCSNLKPHVLDQVVTSEVTLAVKPAESNWTVKVNQIVLSNQTATYIEHYAVYANHGRTEQGVRPAISETVDQAFKAGRISEL